MTYVFLGQDAPDELVDKFREEFSGDGSVVFNFSNQSSKSKSNALNIDKLSIYEENSIEGRFFEEIKKFQKSLFGYLNEEELVYTFFFDSNFVHEWWNDLYLIDSAFHTLEDMDIVQVHVYGGPTFCKIAKLFSVAAGAKTRVHGVRKKEKARFSTLKAILQSYRNCAIDLSISLKRQKPAKQAFVDAIVVGNFPSHWSRGRNRYTGPKDPGDYSHVQSSELLTITRKNQRRLNNPDWTAAHGVTACNERVDILETHARIRDWIKSYLPLFVPFGLLRWFVRLNAVSNSNKVNWRGVDLFPALPKSLWLVPLTDWPANSFLKSLYRRAFSYHKPTKVVVPAFEFCHGRIVTAATTDAAAAPYLMQHASVGPAHLWRLGAAVQTAQTLARRSSCAKAAHVLIEGSNMAGSMKSLGVSPVNCHTVGAPRLLIDDIHAPTQSPKTPATSTITQSLLVLCGRHNADQLLDRILPQLHCFSGKIRIRPHPRNRLAVAQKLAQAATSYDAGQVSLSPNDISLAQDVADLFPCIVVAEDTGGLVDAALAGTGVALLTPLEGPPKNPLWACTNVARFSNFTDVIRFTNDLSKDPFRYQNYSKACEEAAQTLVSCIGEEAQDRLFQVLSRQSVPHA